MWILFAVLGFYFICLCNWRMGRSRAITFGSAQWCNVWTLFRKGLFRRKGLMVGDLTGLLPVHYEQTHAITIGTTGAGKGTAAVVPNLLAYDWIFLLDPGGENSAIASRRWRDAGFEFSCINFFGMHEDAPWELPRHGFNPLDLIDPGSPSFAADALVLAEMLVRRTGNESGSSVFFKNTATAHLRDFIVHCKTTEPPERQNLSTVFHYLHCDADEWDELLSAMMKNPACDYLTRFGAIDMARRQVQADAEFSAIMSTMQEDMNWLIDPGVREYISRSDVNFTLLKGVKPGQRGGVISVVLPLQYNKSHSAISRLALACLILTMQRPPLARNKVLFLIDEAADLGKLSHLPDWLATLRKYNVLLWPIFQNIGQLVDLYGRGWQTLVANCGLLQILGIGNDLETAEHTEKLLGKFTIATETINHDGKRSIGQTARALITADELRRLCRSRQIALIGNLPAILLRKTPYWTRPELAGRFHPNPYYFGKTSGPSRLKAWWGKIYYAHVWLMAPHPIAATALAVPLLYLALGAAGLLGGGG